MSQVIIGKFQILMSNLKIKKFENKARRRRGEAARRRGGEAARRRGFQ